MQDLVEVTVSVRYKDTLVQKSKQEYSGNPLYAVQVMENLVLECSEETGAMLTTQFGDITRGVRSR